MIIVVGGQKGGSGKSCIAQNLAAGLAYRGSCVFLLDADSQKTSSDWAAERENMEDAFPFQYQAMSGDISKTALTLSETFTVIVDCGGRDTKELRSAMVVADLLVVPIRPKRRDLKTLDYVSDLIDKSRMTNPSLVARAVISQAPTLPSQVQRILDAKAVSGSFDIPALDTVIFTRNVYDDADEEGRSVYESDDRKAEEEMRALLNEIMGLLNNNQEPE